jgi:hypothetical protein
VRKNPRPSETWDGVPSRASMLSSSVAGKVGGPYEPVVWRKRFLSEHETKLLLATDDRIPATGSTLPALNTPELPRSALLA